jgi:hypothetical protein
MAGDEKIHAAHCSVFRCVYGDPNCPVNEESAPGGRAEQALAVLREPVDTGGVDTEALDQILRKAGIEYPLGLAGVRDLVNQRNGNLDRAQEAEDLASRAHESMMAKYAEAGDLRDRAEAAEARLAALGTEFAVRNMTSGWVYALPKVLPKFLDGQRGTRECAEWHRRQIAGPDPEDWTGFEIVKRPVGPWEVVS